MNLIHLEVESQFLTPYSYLYAMLIHITVGLLNGFISGGVGNWQHEFVI